MKTIEELRLERDEGQKRKAIEKIRLSEKIFVAEFYPSPSTGDKHREVIELERVNEIFNIYSDFPTYTGKIKVYMRTRKWVESLLELD